MIVGLDLDYTISAFPAWFALVSRALVNDGHEVHVLTHREPGTAASVQVELAGMKIEYTALHLPTDGESPEVWKPRKAAELGLDMMIEDAPEVLARMPAGVHRLWICDPEVFDLDLCIQGMRRKKSET